MALILALNPGNRHSPTLARLARELPACELIGAESSNVAISAIKKRVPDLVLLPATQARGQADLLAHLKTIPGGVMTLHLPPVESADPADLARQIREMLTGVPAQVPVRQAAGRQVALPDEPPAGPSPHLLAAATAAIGWARARRDQWLTEPSPVQAAPRAVPSSTAALDAVEEYRPYEPIEPSESDYPFPIDTLEEPEPGPDYASQMKVWLPRVGGAAVAIAVVAAIILYKPQGGADSTAAEPAAAGSPAAASAQTTLSVTSSDPAEVLIDGTRAGDTPYEGKISLGAHTVTVKTADAERQQTIEATSKPVQLKIDFSKP